MKPSFILLLIVFYHSAFAQFNLGRFEVINKDIPAFASTWLETPGVKAISGDYDGDGQADIALIRQEAGWQSIPIAFSTQPGEFNWTNIALPDFIENWAHLPGVQVHPGDYNGDGKTDFALVRQEGDWQSIPVALSLGNGDFQVSNIDIPPYADVWLETPGVQVIPADYNGDGKTDLALVRQEMNTNWESIPIAFSTQPGEFNWTNVTLTDFDSSWMKLPGVQVHPGDYNGDGRTDFALVQQVGTWNSIPMALSLGNGDFQVTNIDFPPNVNTWLEQSGVKVLPGDYDGDGKTDLALVRQEMNTNWESIPTAFSDGAGGFDWTNVTLTDTNFIKKWAHLPGVQVHPGDYNGDGKTDFALVRQETGWGSIPVATSLGNGDFQITNKDVHRFTEDWTHLPGVEVLSGDFDGRLGTDFALVRKIPGWNSIPMAFSQGQIVAIDRNLVDDANYKAYPNPSSGYITLENLEQIRLISLYSLSGQKIKQFETNHQDVMELDIQEIQSGFYVLQLLDKEGRIVIKRITKQ